MNEGEISLRLDGGYMEVQTNGLNVDEEGKLRFLDSTVRVLTETKEERHELLRLYMECDELGAFDDTERVKIDLRPIYRALDIGTVDKTSTPDADVKELLETDELLRGEGRGDPSTPLRFAQDDTRREGRRDPSTPLRFAQDDTRREGRGDPSTSLRSAQDDTRREGRRDPSTSLRSAQDDTRREGRGDPSTPLRFAQDDTRREARDEEE